MEIGDARRELQHLLERIEGIVGEGANGARSVCKCERCGAKACRCRRCCGSRSSWGLFAAIAGAIGIVAVSTALCRAGDHRK
ncbi:MAG: hypothetical protein EBZ40_09820 [Gammaproteobacteria bacterium]|nr:hypothetical protein [Gammaproteobacteria bacterium]